MKEFHAGRLAGLEISILPAALLGALLLWGVLSGALLVFFNPGIGPALLLGLAGVAIHFFSELMHQLGHAWAARRTGYPMTGIRFGNLALLGTSLYPPDEPELPAGIHIRRALGGFPVNLLLGLLAGFLALRLAPGSALWLLALFACFENLLVFGLGALLPLGFTDGSTLLHYWRKRST